MKKKTYVLAITITKRICNAMLHLKKFLFVENKKWSKQTLPTSKRFGYPCRGRTRYPGICEISNGERNGGHYASLLRRNDCNCCF